MNSLPNQYCFLRASFNLAFQKKSVSVPYLPFSTAVSCHIFRYLVAACSENVVGNERQIGFATTSESFVPRNEEGFFTEEEKVSVKNLDQYHKIGKPLDNKYSKNIRPLLNLSRNVITTICQHEKIPVYPDRSNLSLQHSRNRIRKQIVPAIRVFFNPQIEDALFQFAQLVSQEQDCVSRLFVP